MTPSFRSYRPLWSSRGSLCRTSRLFQIFVIPLGDHCRSILAGPQPWNHKQNQNWQPQYYLIFGFGSPHSFHSPTSSACGTPIAPFISVRNSVPYGFTAHGLRTGDVAGDLAFHPLADRLPTKPRLPIQPCILHGSSWIPRIDYRLQRLALNGINTISCATKPSRCLSGLCAR
jgi:hypothetical protein